MGKGFAEIAFTPNVKAQQEEHGSRNAYAAQEKHPRPDGELGDDELAFIAARDSFYLASTGETGWPYVQHRGGPAGFVTAPDRHTLVFPDYNGNRQYISVGNMTGDDRVCLFFMDYPARERLKVYGHAQLSDDTSSVAGLKLSSERGIAIERLWVVTIAGYDWNCPKNITPRYTEGEIRPIIAARDARIAELEAELAALRAAAANPS